MVAYVEVSEKTSTDVAKGIQLTSKSVQEQSDLIDHMYTCVIDIQEEQARQFAALHKETRKVRENYLKTRSRTQ